LRIALPVIRDFLAMFVPDRRVKLIAEVKKASPSKGLFLADFDPVKLAVTYQGNGAGAVSVITEERFFLGHPSFIAQIKDNIQLPILRKDFIIALVSGCNLGSCRRSMGSRSNICPFAATGDN
jgi:indole-3-glycerol phosphate synthase